MECSLWRLISTMEIDGWLLCPETLMFTGARTSCAQVSEKTNLGLTDCFQAGLTRDRLCFWRTSLLCASLPGDCCVPLGSYGASLPTSGSGLPHHEQQLRFPDGGHSWFSLRLVWKSDYEKTSQPSAGLQGRVGVKGRISGWGSHSRQWKGPWSGGLRALVLVPPRAGCPQASSASSSHRRKHLSWGCICIQAGKPIWEAP